MSSSRGLCAAIALSAAAVSAPGTAAAAVPARCSAGLSVSLLAEEGVRARGRDATYIVATVQPGDRLARRIRVCNGTSQDLPVRLYPNAAAIVDGAFLPQGSPRGENDLSRWTSVTPASLLLRPNVPVDVDVAVVIPPDASAGERYAVVYAEAPPRSGASGVGVASRVGIRQYVFVRGAAAPRSEFSVTTLTAERSKDNRPIVRAAVTNSGDLALDVAGELRLSDGPGGIAAGPFRATLGTSLAPGQSEPVEVLLDPALPAGPWKARLELVSGSTRRAVEATITFPPPGQVAAPVPAKKVPLAQDRRLLVPLAIGLIGLIAALLLAVTLLSRRKRFAALRAQ